MSSADDKQAQVRRLFFALWPAEAIRREIIDRREALGRAGRQVPDRNLHMTLLFLGNQPEGRIPDIVTGAGGVAGRRFDLTLDGLGHFARARVVWLGGPVNAVGQALVAGLETAMIRCKVNFDRRPWRPHVTLFRNVARRPVVPDPPPLIWSVREFALVESVPGKPYQVLKTWPLK